jgi:hypothetical protein
MQQKLCSVCKALKPLADFYKENRVKDGRARRCTECHCKVTNEYRKKNPEIYRKASLKHWHALDDRKKHERWIKRYGITPIQYKKMFEKQNGLCQICNQTCNSGHLLSVDHCHTTGKVRGLLCKKCNTALGMLEDNITYFKNAITYLKNYEESLLTSKPL